nr:hypothetical protein [Gemmatimonadaceae bacterium]
MRLPTLAPRARFASLTRPLVRGATLLTRAVPCAMIGALLGGRLGAQTSAAAVPLQEEVPCTAMR